MMKGKLIRITTIAVAVLLALTVGAAAKVQISFRHWGPNAGVDGVFQKFNESQDEIEVVLAHVAYNEFIEKTLLEIVSGEGPDIFSLHGWPYAEMSLNTWAANGQLLDLSSYWERDKDELNGDAWHPFLIDFATRDGMLVGIPYAWAISGGVNYNADLFDQMGMAYPDAHWTWDDLEDAARKLTELDGEGNAVTIGLESQFSLEHWPDIEDRIRAGGGSLFNESQTELALQQPAARAVLERMAALARNVAIRNTGAWGQGTVGMRIAGIHRATSDKENFDITWRSGFAPSPLDPETLLRSNHVEVTLVGVNPNTKHPDAVWEALKYFVQNYAEMAAETAGYIQFIPANPAGQALFLQQDPARIGNHLAQELPGTLVTMSATAHVGGAYVNPILDDVSAQVGSRLTSEWRKVVRGEVDLFQFFENVSAPINAMLRGE